MTQAEDHALSGEILARMYDSEIHGQLTWFWDAGFEWAVDNGSDDPGSDGQAQTLALATRDMAESASARYPDSEFARWWRNRRT